MATFPANREPCGGDTDIIAEDDIKNRVVRVILDGMAVSLGKDRMRSFTAVPFFFCPICKKSQVRRLISNPLLRFCLEPKTRSGWVLHREPRVTKTLRRRAKKGSTKVAHTLEFCPTVWHGYGYTYDAR